MKTKKPSQLQVIAAAFLRGETLNLSSAYKLTKKYCECGCMKLSTRVSDFFEANGVMFKRDKQGVYVSYTLDIKKTKKPAIEWLKKVAKV